MNNYKKDLIESLTEIHSCMSEDEKYDDQLFNEWIRLIEEKCDEKSLMYIKGEISDYQITESELKDAIDKANENIISDTLSSLVEKDLVQVSIGETGELLYALTEKGKDVRLWSE